MDNTNQTISLDRTAQTMWTAIKFWLQFGFSLWPMTGLFVCWATAGKIQLLTGFTVPLWAKGTVYGIVLIVAIYVVFHLWQREDGSKSTPSHTEKEPMLVEMVYGVGIGTIIVFAFFLWLIFSW